MLAKSFAGHSASIRPFLKWAGGKYNILDVILTKIQSGKRLVEPFGGAGAVFLNAPFEHCLVSEKNPDLIGLYQQLQQEGLSFIDYCASFFTPTHNTADYYYEARVVFNQCTDRRERAALFLYLNRHGYNGLCRYNQKGGFNVPFGRYVRPYFPETELLFFIQKSQKISFAHQDFRQTFQQLQPGDTIYCDPPYVDTFTHYTHQSFNQNDQIALAQCAREAASTGYTVVISNSDTPFIRTHYEGSDIHSFPMKRRINCQAVRRAQIAQELIAVFRPTHDK